MASESGNGKGPNPELFYDAQWSTTALTWEIPEAGLKGILDETDYMFRVDHSYTGMDDPTGLINKGKDFFNKAGDYLNYGTVVKDNLPNVAGKVLKDVFGMKTAGDTVKNAMSGLFDAAEQGVNTAAEFLGIDDVLNANAERLKKSRFFNALDFIKVFQGTTIDFAIPELKTIILSEGCDNMTVKAKIDALNNVFIGDVEDFSGMFGLQKSPNNYVPQFTGNNQKNNYPGTFTLRLGDFAKLENLVLTNYNVVLSKHKRKDPQGVDDYLWAEVTVSLLPASYVTKKMVKDYFKLG